MNEKLEAELKRALARQEPPDGFADRVLGKVPDKAAGTGRGFIWYAAMAAAILVALLISGIHKSQQQRDLEARKTERQVAFAFALAAEKLEQINVNLERSAPEVKLQKRQEKRYE